jgi:hypothetical protein
MARGNFPIHPHRQLVNAPMELAVHLAPSRGPCRGGAGAA